MFLVRYLALAALAIWLGGTVTLMVLTTPTHETLRSFELAALVCGAVIIISQLVMKFVGPPPVSFVPRFAIAVVMVALVAYSLHTSLSSPAPATIGAALGFVLLSWYARE